jgi:hypothetical protein
MTRRRPTKLFDASDAEFAIHGISGARVVRLAAWYQLEPGDRPLPEVIRKSQQDKTATDAAPVRPEQCDEVPVTEQRRMVIAAVTAILAS